MIFYLIKNYLKMMLRSSSNILMYILAPTIVAAVLTSAFTTLMDSYKAPETFEVGYRVSEGSVFSNGMNALKETLNDKGVIMTEYTEGDPEEIMGRMELSVFVEFKDNEYLLYKNRDARVEGQILEYALGEWCSYMMSGGAETVGSVQGVGKSGEKTAEMFAAITEASEIKVEHPFFVPAIDSTDYYGIIEIAYFAWCSIICGAMVFTAEKKYRIGRRFAMSGVSEFKLYISRLVPIVMSVAIGLLLSAVIGIVFFDVHWGNALLSALVVLMSIFAATSFELVIYNATSSMVATVVISFAIVWFMGFFGGSFETYMFSSAPQVLKDFSPIYYENRALVELSCMGKSDYTIKSILISGAIGIVGSALNIGILKLRKERS
ncbi:MAG: ABC transporter permease [Lachnospiraceae bacterium]|nr:ABC transporter permease [Lachnospiraceae bacterium]